MAHDNLYFSVGKGGGENEWWLTELVDGFFCTCLVVFGKGIIQNFYLVSKSSQYSRPPRTFPSRPLPPTPVDIVLALYYPPLGGRVKFDTRAALILGIVKPITKVL